MMIQGQEKPSLDDIRHHGVKGMKWGERKANPTGAEIHKARERQAGLINARNNADVEVRTARTQAERNKAMRKANRIADEFNTSEDRVTAARMTSGEKIAAVLTTGPLGLIIIGHSNSVVKRAAKSVDQARRA